MTGLSKYSVAITGHRPNRIKISDRDVSRRIRWVLAAFRVELNAQRSVAFSALAEGSDRLFALDALRLGYELCVLLPFERNVYEATFSDQGATAMYRDLLTSAQSVAELPGTLSDTKSAYEAVGHALVASADVLLAVWDGEPAAGRGGTPVVIEQALELGKPVIWIDATRLLLPRLITRGSAQDADVGSVGGVLTRDDRLTRFKVASLAPRV